MLKINYEKMQAAGFNFSDLSEVKIYCDSLLEYFNFHNTNLTREQERRISTLQEIAFFIEED